MAARYQLTNPRRLFRAVAALALTLSFVFAGISVSQAGSEISGGSLQFITVQAGDSLWTLAETHAGDADPRDWIAEVVLLNALTSSELAPGQQIALP
ncbi:MAG: hypothetical protein RIS51_13 [Actinomycetota bacterium]|jgi:predicted Zn-dependent protease